MNKALTRVALAATLAMGAAQAQAQNAADLLKELQSLKDRVAELERKLEAASRAQQQAPAAAAAPAPAAAGMTPEQQRELSRVAVKAEAVQDAMTDLGYKGLKISGAIDPTWIYNRAQNNASFVLLNNGDARYTYDNSYFGMAVLDLEKETDSGARWKLTLAPERGTGALFNGRSIVHEASVSVPLSDLQTRLWLGQIPDWTGYELTMPALNRFITHNLLFDLTAPTAYTGAVLDMKRGKWWSRIGLANMNNARTAAGNKSPVLIYRVDYARGEFAGFGFTGLHGKISNFAADGSYLADPNDPTSETTFAEAGKATMANLLEFDAYFVRGDWSVFGQVSYGTQKKAAIFNSDGVLRDARWWGLSATAGYNITPRLQALARADYVRNNRNGGGLLGYSFDDGLNGIGRGFKPNGDYAKGADVGANRYALSLGLNYLYDESTNWKLELRFDGADQPVFQQAKDGSFRKSNVLLGTSVVVKF